MSSIESPRNVQNSIGMEVIHLVIEDAEVAKLRNGPVEPTFEIRCKGKTYPCNPEPATDSAMIEFDGFSNARFVGFLELQCSDENNLLPAIIDFIHGKSLLIDTANAHDLMVLADELGIPVISMHAKRLLNDL